jgi:predicted RNase H-like nuclease (RuvC/YqgF family)
MKHSRGNNSISEEKNFGENEILKKLLEKMEKLEKENKELKNEIQKMKSNNKNNNKSLINNIDKPLNELKSEKKVEKQPNNDLLFGSRNECYNSDHLIKLIEIGNLDAIKNIYVLIMQEL